MCRALSSLQGNRQLECPGTRKNCSQHTFVLSDHVWERISFTTSCRPWLMPSLLLAALLGLHQGPATPPQRLYQRFSEGNLQVTSCCLLVLLSVCSVWEILRVNRSMLEFFLEQLANTQGPWSPLRSFRAQVLFSCLPGVVKAHTFR